LEIRNQDQVPVTFQSSPYDKLRAGSAGLDFERVVLTLTSLAREVRLFNGHLAKRTSGAEALIDAAYCGTAEAVPFVQSGD
jgi:hypothetical protein